MASMILKWRWVCLSICFALCVMHTTYGDGLHEHSDVQPIEYVTIAILAKDKEHTLPLYLSCIEKQTWPSQKTYLYIRTNNNNDRTSDILRDWIEKNHEKYADIYFDDTDVPEPVQQYKQHEWNCERFKVLGKIRQDSIAWAHAKKSHYFVADCDNMIKPHTLQALLDTNLAIVGPLLKTGHNLYANYHAAIDEQGYYVGSPLYDSLWSQEIKGLVEVPVIHCTYLIRYEFLDKLSYDDESYRYEYVIFSDSARKKKIPQYLDNRDMYGYISFAENKQQLHNEPWLPNFVAAMSLHLQ